MTVHVSDDVLARFVDGDVDETVAVTVAEHIDGCSVCATRAAALDPMNAVFASAPIGEPPEHLAAQVIAQVNGPSFASPAVGVSTAGTAQLGSPSRAPLVEIGVGAALLGLAGLLAAAFDGPWALMADVGGTFAGGLALARGVGVVLASFQVVVAATTVLASAGVVLTLQYSALVPRSRVRRPTDPPAGREVAR